MSLEGLRELAGRIRAETAKAIVGQDALIDYLLIATLAQGHALLEGPPGTAKTFLAQSFATALGLDFGRIQFTPDLLPGDILGSNLFNFQTSQFTLTRGPIFCELLLADETRALAALSVIRFMSEDYFDRVVFDLTLNGLGGSMNLLTFAFNPPFLAATICLVLAMLILGWRAFFRFGPALVPARETALGKAQLVANGADLIVRGQRFELLKQPYAALSARRLAQRLGLATGASPPTHTALETALKARGDETGSFIARSSELTSATSAEAIVNAALSLHQQASRRPPDQKEISPQ
jgi:hypothetical protein